MRVEDPVLTYRGEHVGLGPLRKDVAPLIQKWWNDPEIMLPLSNTVFPQTERDIETWLQRYDDESDGEQINFLIYELETSRPIGVVNLSQINYRNQTAWASSYIGERDVWGRGYGTEARRLVLAHGFHVCGLNNVTVAIHADNFGSLRVAEKVGYREIGRQRQGVRRAGKYVDIVFLDILASDFEESIP